MDRKLAFIVSLVIAVGLFCAAQRGEQGILTQTVASSATWSLVHHTFCSSVTCVGGGTVTATSSSCVVIVPLITSGNKLIIWIGEGNTATQRTISSVTGVTGVTLCGSTCQKYNAGGPGSVDGAYSTSAGASASITITLSGAAANYFSCIIDEYSSTNAASFDVANIALDGSCTTCAAQSLSLTGSNDVISLIALPNQAISAISSSGTWANPQTFTDGFGVAGALTQSSYSAPNWTNSPSDLVMVAGMALKQ